MIRDFEPNDEGIDPEVEINMHHLGFCLIYVPLSPKARLLCALQFPLSASVDDGLGWKRTPEEAEADFDFLFNSGLVMRTLPGDQVISSKDIEADDSDAKPRLSGVGKKKKERVN